MVQPAGADRRLRVLADLLRDPGAALVAHRPERRAVVRLGDGSYAKVVRPDRAAEVARTARAAAVPGVRVPPVLHVDAHAGVVVTGPLPGRTLHALLGDPTADVVTAAREVGRTLAALHTTPPPPTPRCTTPPRSSRCCTAGRRSPRRTACRSTSRSRRGRAAPVRW
ncbi:phosphotransferase [Cellulomonas sp. ATA003]|uniref:phosphotransferase n=1 Tax=Cellulomonas sp. ATA003 TaxID=3073064 RepID=UPI0037BE7EEF